MPPTGAGKQFGVTAVRTTAEILYANTIAAGMQFPAVFLRAAKTGKFKIVLLKVIQKVIIKKKGG